MSEGSPVDALGAGTLRDWAVLIGSDRDREVKVMWAHAGRDPEHGERGVGKKRYRSVDTGDDLPTDRHMRPDPHQGRRTTN